MDVARFHALPALGTDPAVQAVREVLAGDKGPKRDIVLLNAGAAILVGNGAQNLKDGIAQAAQSIDTGAAQKALQKMIEITNNGYSPFVSVRAKKNAKPPDLIGVKNDKFQYR